MGAEIAIVIGWVLDLIMGDPMGLPHPIVWFGRAISYCEHRWNSGGHRKAKGAVVALVLVAGVFFLVAAIDQLMISIGLLAVVAFRSLVVFYGLAGTTLTREVRMVFEAVDRSLEEGRKQVARIVGRDTGKLSAQEVRTAALETLAENLSDGVVAPLFWLAVGGVPAMMAYKMVNTLDSMVGYCTDRYRDFGCVAARLDDVANFIPARLTALLMVTVSGKWGLMAFVRRFGPCHASPNSGYPEAALAGILNCRFGGPHDYFGQLFEKPFIGDNEKMLTTEDMRKAISINRRVEAVTVALTFIVRGLL
ncbi:MAG: cobalamin biosynthesis protein CobD [Prevotella sp.]|nr:cobalamin biosynthesis protein CobD [Prevotella sp.]